MAVQAPDAKPAKVTIREQIHDALHTAGPAGLTMAAIAGAVTGPWRSRAVDDVVRKLWQANELGRRQDGTFVLTQKVASERHESTPAARRRRRDLDAAVKRVAHGAQREGHSTKITTRQVDPALLSAYCAGCRKTVHPRLDGTCSTCGFQTGANVDDSRKPRRRRRRKPLKEGQAAFGIVCRCGAPKTKQAHCCRACGQKRRSGRQLGPRPNHAPAKNITDELLLECRRLYASGLSIRQIAEQIHPRTTYASVNACKTSLFSLFKTRGWKLRPQAEVTRARSTKHGRKPRKRTNEQERSYRRWLRDQRGWKALQGPGRPICKGVKLQPPGKGSPCEHHALEDSEYCYSHDPRRELERQAACAKMRARGVYREPVLPAPLFAAWLEQLRHELGGWKYVAALVGADQSQVHRWGTGQTRRVAVRVVRRSAENAGTTLEAIYGPDVDVDQLAVAA